jgi:hypothetical protein
MGCDEGLGLFFEVFEKSTRCLTVFTDVNNKWLCANCILPQREVLLGMGENTVNE